MSAAEDFGLPRVRLVAEDLKQRGRVETEGQELFRSETHGLMVIR